MPTISKSFVLSKPIGTTWLFLNNFESVGRCLPGCQEVRVLSETKSYWKIKVNAGIVSRILETEVSKNADETNGRISFHIQTKSGDLKGDLVVALQSSIDSTNVDLKFDVQAMGAFSWLVNQMLGKQSEKMIAEFVQCVNSGI